jgi:hypothetical protein
MQANDDAEAISAGRMDTGGTDGARLLAPPFPISTSIPIKLHDGVSIEGNSRASSRIITRDNFPAMVPGNHILNIGDGGGYLTGHASFGGQVKNINISAKKGLVTVPGNFAVFSNNIQDSGAVVDNCRLDGGSHFGGFKYMEGRGGATFVHLSDVEVIARQDAHAIGNVCLAIKVAGATQVYLTRISPSCDWVDNNNLALGAIPGSYGLVLYGGTFHIDGVHGEAVQRPITFAEYGAYGTPQDDFYSPGTDGYCRAIVKNVSGGGGNTELVRIDSPTGKWLNKITLENIMPKTPSITTVVKRAQGTDITTEIIDPIRI